MAIDRIFENESTHEVGNILLRWEYIDVKQIKHAPGHEMWIDL